MYCEPKIGLLALLYVGFSGKRLVLLLCVGFDFWELMSQGSMKLEGMN